MVIRRLTSLLLGLSLALGVVAPAHAEQVLAVVNIQSIMQKSKAAESVRAQVKAKQKAYQATANKKEKDLQKADQDLAKQRSLLSQEAFEEQVLEFRKKVGAAQRDDQKKRLELNKAQAQAVDTIQKNVTSIVADIAKEKKISAVFPTTPVLYADASLDITEDVLKRLDKKLPKLNVKF